MSQRDIDSALLAALAGGEVVPVVLAQLTFRSQTVWVWTGVDPLVWNGQTYLGLGKLGTIADVTESTEVRADGTSVTLNGIDNALLGESLTDIRPGAPAKIWFGVFQPGTRTFLGTPFLYFSGQIDQATVQLGIKTSSITLALESRLVNQQRAANWRYTSNDQHALGYPDDTAFDSVERLNDFVVPWGA